MQREEGQEEGEEEGGGEEEGRPTSSLPISCQLLLQRVNGALDNEGEGNEEEEGEEKEREVEGGGGRADSHRRPHCCDRGDRG